MPGTSWPVRASIAASVWMDSGSRSRRLLGASSRCSSATRSTAPTARVSATVVRSKSAGLGSKASWVMDFSFSRSCRTAPRVLPRGAVRRRRGLCPRPCRAGGAECLDRVRGDDVEAVGGVGEHADAAGLDGQRLGADRQGDRWGAEVGQPADLAHAGLGVVPAAVGDDVDRARPAGGFNVEVFGAAGDRVAGERGAAAGADRGDLWHRRGAVAQQLGGVAEEDGGGLAPIAGNAVVTIQTIGPSAYSWACIEPEVSTTSSAWGCSSGAVISRVSVQGWLAMGRPVARSKRARA